MPSPELTPPPHHRHDNLLYPLIAAALSFSLLFFLAFLYRKLTLSRTSPAPLSPPTNELRRFHFSALKKATSSFAPSNRLGQGGFGSVYRAVIQNTGEVYAVKVMDAAAGSIQGEREFHNEVSLASRVLATVGSPYLVSVVGYATAERRRKEEERKVIVYEFMSNGSLQEKLLDGKCGELAMWEKRWRIVIDIAKGLKFLHFDCGDTAVVHGDVKPSNVLLDEEFNAKLGDFGLARVSDTAEAERCIDVNDKVEEDVEIGSIVEEEEESSVVTVDQSPITEGGAVVSCSPSEGFERASSLPEIWNDKISVENGKKKGGGGWGSGRDYWWWKQGEESSGRVKDYVMEWIGSEIKKERPKSSDLGVGCNDGSIVCNDVVINVDDGRKKIEEEKKHKKKRLDWWWMSLDYDEAKMRKKREKNGRKPREWWKEEFCDELTKKKKKKKNKKSKSSVGSEMWWQRDEDFVAPERKKRRKKSKSSFGSIDWWLDGLSGELRGGGGCRRNSHDWGANVDIPKSGGISSTPSMRGTVCYIAPECGGGGDVSEKCDVYSFGVLVLVIISGRRPLQVLASPMSEFERANLVSWARQLAYNGRLLDLVDTTIQSLDSDQAMLCITVALLCLQRSPSKRPNMKEIVEMLCGEAEPPHLPFEFSPSPPLNFPFKSRKKGR